MIDMKIEYWLKLRNVDFDIHYAPYILSVFLDIPAWRVLQMKAGIVIAIYNHIKHQVEKCNKIFDNVQSILLNIDEGVNKEYFEGIEAPTMIYDLAGGDIVKGEQIEKLTFAHVMTWLKVTNAYIRVEQDRYMKNKMKLPK
jgi:hypothetical protein